MLNRRDFLKKAAIVGLGAIATPGILKAAIPVTQGLPKSPKIKLKPQSIILLQGDSITDAGRNRGVEQTSNDQNMLGNGYPLFIASQLLCDYPEHNLRIYNRGISGNKVYQLLERWGKDCIEVKPDVLSILIGVNDYWHTKTGGYKGTVQTYADDYRTLISDTLKHFPDIQLVIGEPFTVKGGSALDENWYPAFDEYRKTAAAIANEFGAVFVPYQSVFDAALKKAPSIYWSPDGVHPSMAGARLMADAWSKACGL